MKKLEGKTAQISLHYSLNTLLLLRFTVTMIPALMKQNPDEFFTFRAVCVLQTETGFVTLRDLRAVQGQEVIVCEDLNTVVMSVREDQKHSRHVTRSWPLIGL